MPEEQHGRSVLRVPLGRCATLDSRCELEYDWGTGTRRCCGWNSNGTYAVIPVQFGGLPAGVGQTLLMFTMKRGIVATFDPEYSDKRMPDCTLMVTLDVAVFATFSLLKLFY